MIRREGRDVFLWNSLFLGAYRASESNLRTACLVLQKQIEHIGEHEEKIVIPGVKMREIREQAGIGLFLFFSSLTSCF